MSRLRGLSKQEQVACQIAERVLGAVAEPWDVDGRNGAVDAMLALADGRRAAFEVTVLAAAGAIQTDALLYADDNSWPLPGAWTWTIRVGDPSDIPRLRNSYQNIALACEAAGVERPQELIWHRRTSDSDLRWLVEESTSQMFGHSTVPAVDGEKVRSAMLVPRGRGGAVDVSLEGLRGALQQAFGEHHLPRHIEKLSRADADERHLFIPIHFSALPFPVADGLRRGEAIPPEPPPLPEEITHLWLAPSFSRRVLLWSNTGWSYHNQYDN
ncbi:hypothetical protein [Nocardia sp. NPDC052316]|uniref:hypothetical protein n=1 Tax=Nocardia sp. NPDC052316 TaxID=3364329 RepID=UPI0037C6AAE5